MKLPPEQNKFVAPNVVSLAQAWLYYDDARPLAICDGDEVVGFMMLDWDEDERTMGIWRFMIAPEHQHKGYGRQAMQAAIELGREAENIDLLHLDYLPGNDAARALYYSLGFRENGDEEDGEIIMTMRVTDSPRVGMLTADEDFSELIAAEIGLGKPVPESMRSADSVEQAVKNGELLRLTLYGETIGMAIGGELLLGSEYQQYLDEAASIVAASGRQ